MDDNLNKADVKYAPTNQHSANEDSIGDGVIIFCVRIIIKKSVNTFANVIYKLSKSYFGIRNYYA